MRELNDDLKLVPEPYRDPFSKYIWHGPIPYSHPPLMAALTGQREAAVAMDPAMEIVLALLDKHEQHLDVAHGHLAWLLRWQGEGGKAGRK
jgi:hypothetical protein